jgi:hypothetical protein
MKHIKILTACLVLLTGLAYTASGATNAVIVGQDVQSVINASAPGDTLIVQPGVYPDASLVFNKPLTVLVASTNGAVMQFLGNIQVTGAGASSFQQAYFGGSLQTTGAMVSFFDSIFNGPVTVAGGKLTMKRTILNYPLTLTNNATLEALRMTNTASVTATATVGAKIPFLAVQCLFSNGVDLTGYSAWLGYNTLYGNYSSTWFPNLPPGYGCVLIQTNCDSVLIGNIVNGYAAYDIYQSGGTLKAYNNLISTGYYGIDLNSAAAEIVNNTFLSAYDETGIQANGGGPVTLRANIIRTGMQYSDSGHTFPAVQATGAASQALFVSYCDILNGIEGINYALVGVTIPPVNCLLEVNPNVNTDGSLNAGSPCINAGPPDAIYNNRDGTRNTIGYTGGPFFNPANYTNNNPMVFFLLTGQQTVLSGLQTNISVSAAASAGH